AARSCYVGTAGAFSAGNVLPVVMAPPARINGVFHYDSRVGIRDITDGTSNTLMVGEIRHYGTTAFGASDSFQWDGKLYASFRPNHDNAPSASGESLMRPLSTRMNVPVTAPQRDRFESFGSHHPGGA